jgi:8-oxo-dGTP pyrophosphatase MutT (NUDIX family)
MGDFIPEAHVKGFDGFNFIALICSNCFATCFANSFLSIMPQKYKVFFNQSIVYLVKRNESNFPYNTLITNPKTSDIQKLTKVLLKETKKITVVLECDSLELSWKIFKSQFNIRKAAGGLVINQNHELLFIKRKGLWDLPKGHIEKGEKTKTAALREVTEECGISGQTIIKKITTTYHTYYLNNEPVLKPSVWYLMTYVGDNKTQPQEKEGITEVIWVPYTKIPDYITNSYPSIASLLQLFIGSGTDS